MAFLHLLKTQTAEVHAALETQLDIVRHFESRTSYLKLLEGFFTLYEPLEQRLATAMDWSAEGWDYEGRRKTPWLVEDLAALGLVPQDVAALSRCVDLPDIHCPAAAVGCLYVLEGSTLGGQVITRLLGQHLDIPPDQGGSFFAGYGPETVGRWREFGTWAEAWSTRHPQDHPAAVQAARQTFDVFARWLPS
ncbi:biliverdin-producing heme oxygenase [Prosthecobacter algae]|uniref:Biliverdin-producing heme oxygenase n=1 Tax=Prosthecobacter algae TaxID=1144682 RepID=A0ABP9P842_9BACT